MVRGELESVSGDKMLHPDSIGLGHDNYSKLMTLQVLLTSHSVPFVWFLP